MVDVPPLEALGNRIAIVGPSSTGKSTLAIAIGRKLGVPARHLDQMCFRPNSDWVRRPDDEFRALHDEAILADGWVTDGNYSKLMPQRLARATGLILTDASRWLSLYRYVRRSLFERGRAGTLEGAQDSIKWNMIHWIAVRAPPNQKRYRATLRASGIPLVETYGMADVNRLYAAWSLTRD